MDWKKREKIRDIDEPYTNSEIDRELQNDDSSDLEYGWANSSDEEQSVCIPDEAENSDSQDDSDSGADDEQGLDLPLPPSSYIVSNQDNKVYSHTLNENGLFSSHEPILSNDMFDMDQEVQNNIEIVAFEDLPNVGNLEPVDFIVMELDESNEENILATNQNANSDGELNTGDQVDINVQNVVSQIHEHYLNTQGLWKNTTNNPTIHNFTGQEKVNIDSRDPVEIFNFLFDEELINKIVDWVNSRADVVRGTPASKHANVNWWKPTNVRELKQFLGICMLMGNIKLPSIKHYWATTGLYEHPIFGRTMSRNRFEILLRFLSFYDPDIDHSKNKLYKISNVLNHLLLNFTKAFSPGKHLSLDEAMVLFRGRLSFRQYIKNKRHKYGIKLYELCTHDGYILNIIIYCGKGTMITDEKSHTFTVVTCLMENYINKGHTLYLDNFYNSVELAEHLMKVKTNMCGTLQAARAGNPQIVIDTKLKKGECISRQKEDVTVLKWKDKRNVLMISTTDGPDIEQITNKRKQVVQKPKMVLNYNKHMSGIDRSDQMISYYSIPRKSVRWYLKIFFHLIDASLWNATYLYEKVTNESCSYLAFRDKIIVDFIQPEPAPRHPTRQRHIIQKLEKRVRCRVCKMKDKKRTQTFYSCSVCRDAKNNDIGLCPTPCFAEWHKNE